MANTQPDHGTTAAPRSKKGDEQLVRDNIHWMRALATQILRDRSLAEDAIQEAFINIFQKLDDFEGRSSLKTWLHRITVNAALAKLRQLKRYSERYAEQSIDELLPEFEQHDCRIEAPWPHLMSVQDIIESKNLQQQVRNSIDALPDNYRIVILLRDIEGYDTNEVADLIGVSASNVKVRLHRARAALKKLLEPVLRGDISL
ncbi:MAG: RNA polymerase sigma-70 factor (ECF subfamily) [Candidatus Endobugula sp.]|jgi:RNA polymerase sigma-70 factor (ECF subfamily)